MNIIPLPDNLRMDEYFNIKDNMMLNEEL